jgi:hypothetical protein
LLIFRTTRVQRPGKAAPPALYSSTGSDSLGNQGITDGFVIGEEQDAAEDVNGGGVVFGKLSAVTSKCTTRGHFKMPHPLGFN